MQELENTLKILNDKIADCEKQITKLFDEYSDEEHELRVQKVIKEELQVFKRNLLKSKANLQAKLKDAKDQEIIKYELEGKDRIIKHNEDFYNYTVTEEEKTTEKLQTITHNLHSKIAENANLRDEVKNTIVEFKDNLPQFDDNTLNDYKNTINDIFTRDDLKQMTNTIFENNNHSKSK